MDVRVGLWRKLSAKELMLLNCGVGEDSWESLGLPGDPTSPFWRRSALGFLWKEWGSSWNSSTLPPYAKSWFFGKDPDAGRDWGREDKGTTEDEMAGWHHWLDGHESEWTPRVGDGQGGPACCDLRGRKESDTTEQLIWSDAMDGPSPPLRNVSKVTVLPNKILISNLLSFTLPTLSFFAEYSTLFFIQKIENIEWKLHLPTAKSRNLSSFTSCLLCSRLLLWRAVSPPWLWASPTDSQGLSVTFPATCTLSYILGLSLLLIPTYV